MLKFFRMISILEGVVSHKRGWSIVIWLLVLLASIIPFAFLIVEFFLQKELKKS